MRRTHGRRRSSARPARPRSRVELALDGSGEYDVSTGIPFFDHMLESFAKHGMFDLRAAREGRPRRRPAPHRRGRRHRDRERDPPGARQRGGHPPLRPGAAADGGGEGRGRGRRLEPALPRLPVELDERPRRRLRRVSLAEDFLYALSQNAGLDLHVELRYGKSPHHVVEAIFKGVARALRAGARARSARRRRPVGEGSVVAAVSAPPEIAVVDYGAGNLRSVAKALERSGLKVAVTSDPEALPRASGVVLPGVGNFADAAARLRASGLAEARARRARRRPALPRTLPRPPAPLRGERRARADAGLRLAARAASSASPRAARTARALRVPHIGWNRVRFRGDHPMIAGLPPRGRLLLRARLPCGAARIPSGSPASRSTGATSPRRSRTRASSPCSSIRRRASGPGSDCSTPSQPGCAARERRGRSALAAAARRRAAGLRRRDGAPALVPAPRGGRRADHQGGGGALRHRGRPRRRRSAAREIEASVTVGAPPPETGVGARRGDRARRPLPLRGARQAGPRRHDPGGPRPRAGRGRRQHPSAPREVARLANERFGAQAVVLGSVARYRERTGGAQESGAASVWFEVALYTAPEGEKLWSGVFNETQRPLSENVLVARPLSGRRHRAGSRPRSSRAGAPRRRPRSMPLGTTAGPARDPEPWPASS